MHPRTFVGAVASAALLATLLAGSPGGAAAQATDSTPTATPSPTATGTVSSTPTSTPTPGAAPGAAVPSPSATPAPDAASFISNVPCATGDAHAPGGVQRSERRGDDQDNEGGQDRDEFRTGNGRNVILLHNCTDNQLRVRGNIQLNTIPGRHVDPLNEAYAEGTCTNCQTFAVALQVDLYSGERATEVAPQNQAVAVNTRCTGCRTVALAIQYVQPVDDPNEVPEDVADTLNQLEQELNAVQQDPGISLADAEARLSSIVQRFGALGGSLGQQRDEKND